MFEPFFETLASLSRTAIRCRCSISPWCAPTSPRRGKRGQQGHAVGRSRDGFPTKIHRKSDVDGHPLACHLIRGEVGDGPRFKLLLDLGPGVKPRAALADKGYDAKANRALARARCIAPALPFESNAKDLPAFFPKALYRGRARIEHCFQKLKRFKRVALRCEKTERGLNAIVALAFS